MIKNTYHAEYLKHKSAYKSLDKFNLIGGLYPQTDVMYNWDELKLDDNDVKEIEKLNKLKEEKNIHVVIISGPSHSGKSTLAKELSEKLKINKVVISQDHFFRKDVKQRLNKNYDTPQAIDHMRLRNKIIEQLESMPSNSVLIIEGFMTYFDPFLPSISNVNIWIDASDPQLLAERRQQTGQNFLGVEWYKSVVWPNHLKYIEYTDNLFRDNARLIQRNILKTTDNIYDNVSKALLLISSNMGIQMGGGCKDLLTIGSFYDMVEVPVDSLEKIMSADAKTKDIYNKLINLKSILEKEGNKVYFVPKTESTSGGYWGDYAYDYLDEKYKLDILKDKYVFFEIYLNKTGDKVNAKWGVLGIVSKRDVEDKQNLADILNKEFGDRFSWGGGIYEPIKIAYDPIKKRKTIKNNSAKDDAIKSIIRVSINVVNDIFKDPNTFNVLENVMQQLVGNENLSYKYGAHNIEFNIYGGTSDLFNDIEPKLKDFLEKDEDVKDFTIEFND